MTYDRTVVGTAYHRMSAVRVSPGLVEFEKVLECRRCAAQSFELPGRKLVDEQSTLLSAP